MSAVEYSEPPSQELVLDRVYDRFRFNPKHGHRSPVQTRTVLSVASFLLRSETNLSVSQIAAALNCEEAAISKLLEHGTRIVGTSSELQEMVIGIKTDIKDRQRMSALHALLEKHSEAPPRIELSIESDEPAITKAVATILRVGVTRFYGDERKQIVADARNIAMALVKKLNPDLSHANIGIMYGGRDASTARSGIHRVSETVQRPFAKDKKNLYQKIKLVCDMVNMEPTELIIEEDQ